MNNPWLRLYTEAIDDEKLRLLAFEDRWHFIALLCCKGKGIIDEPHKDLMFRKVSVKLGIDPRTLEEVSRRLADVGLIEEKTLQPLAWDRHINRAWLRPSPEVWKIIRQRIFERDDFTCQYCGSRGIRLECDHVIPVSRGGESEDTNLVTACFSCNRSKRDYLLEGWMQ